TRLIAESKSAIADGVIDDARDGAFLAHDLGYAASEIRPVEAAQCNLPMNLEALSQCDDAEVIAEARRVNCDHLLVCLVSHHRHTSAACTEHHFRADEVRIAGAGEFTFDPYSNEVAVLTIVLDPCRDLPFVRERDCAAIDAGIVVALRLSAVLEKTA